MAKVTSFHMKENDCCNAYKYRWMDIECALDKYDQELLKELGIK